MRYVEQELALTPEQSKLFRAALVRQREQMDAVHESVRAEWGRVLTAEERDRWKPLEEKWGRDGGRGR